MALDRLELHEALSPHSNFGTGSIYAWGQEIGKHFKIDSLIINDLGKVEVPLKKEAITKIISRFKTPAVKQMNSCQVPAEYICIQHENSIKESLKCSAARAVREKFEIGQEKFRADIDVYLKGLIICKHNESYKEMISQKTHHGTFGTLLLQLPLHSVSTVGASVKTLLWRKTAHFKYEKKPPFYLTLVAGDRNAIYSAKAVTVQPLKKAPVAFLVFSLVWLDSLRLARVLKPDAFPNFLKKTQLASQALAGWRKARKKQRDSNKPSGSELSKKILPLSAKKTNALCIPLTHTYHAFDFRMDNLQKNDVLTANILMAIPHIDVNLVIVKVENPTQPAESIDDAKEQTVEDKQKPDEVDDRESEEEDGFTVVFAESQDDSEASVTYPAKETLATLSDSSDDEESIASCEIQPAKKIEPVIDWKKAAIDGQQKTFTVHQWIHGDWTFPALHEKFPSLRCDRHLVGNITAIVEDVSCRDTSEPAKKRARTECPVNVSYHPAIFIRPRKEAVADCWEHDPIRTVQYLIQRVTSSLDQISNGKQSERHYLLQDANFICDLVVKNGDKLTDCQRTAILHLLLYTFTRLKAIDEGLAIMHLISQRQCKCTKAHKLTGFDNLISERNFCDIESVVVEIVALAGWEKCSSAVCAMYSRQKGNDYVRLSYLSSKFIGDDCTEPGVTFAKAALTLLAKLKDGVRRFELDCDDIDVYIDLAESVDQQSRLEIYELLGKVSEKNAYPLHIMIRYYFDRGAGDKLQDLESSITRIIGQVDVCSGKYDAEVVSAISFLHHTKNAELKEQLWAKLLRGEDGTCVFEQLLLNEDTWNYLDHCGTFYKALASLPAAKDRFYTFIEDQKRSINDSTKGYWLEGAFFHLTMAELEPGLIEMDKFESYCSTFKGKSVEWMANTVAAIVRYNKDNPRMPPISKTICSTLIECLPIGDLANLMSQETKDLSNVVSCYVKLGDRSSKLKLIDVLKETFLNGNQREEFDDNPKMNARLFNTWLACLKANFNETTSMIHQVFNFFKVYLESKNVRSGEAKVGHLNDLSQVLTFEFLEKFLVAILERENEGTAFKCLKQSNCQWEISRVLCDVFATHPKMKKEILKFDAERTEKVMHCFFWLGSRVANERFAYLVCSEPSTTMSMTIITSVELRRCALGSPPSHTALQRVIRHCIERMYLGAETQRDSWKRPEASVAEHPEVEEFYRLNERSKSFGPFAKASEAKRFGKSATKDLQWASYVISKTGSACFCEITKLYPKLHDAEYSLRSMYHLLQPSSQDRLSPMAMAEEMAAKNKCVICITAPLMSQLLEIYG